MVVWWVAEPRRLVLGQTVAPGPELNHGEALAIPGLDGTGCLVLLQGRGKARLFVI